jgi:hypothetical protein
LHDAEAALNKVQSDLQAVRLRVLRIAGEGLFDDPTGGSFEAIALPDECRLLADPRPVDHADCVGREAEFDPSFMISALGGQRWINLRHLWKVLGDLVEVLLLFLLLILT